MFNHDGTIPAQEKTGKEFLPLDTILESKDSGRDAERIENCNDIADLVEALKQIAVNVKREIKTPGGGLKERNITGIILGHDEYFSFDGDSERPQVRSLEDIIAEISAHTNRANISKEFHNIDVKSAFGQKVSALVEAELASRT
jgi:hypothetical protein